MSVADNRSNKKQADYGFNEQFIVFFEREFLCRRGNYLWQREELDDLLVEQALQIEVERCDKSVIFALYLGVNSAKSDSASLKPVTMNSLPENPLPANSLKVNYSDAEVAALCGRLDAQVISLRSLLMEQGPGDFAVVGKASQLVNWYLSHRYCGSCGAKTHQPDSQQAAMQCNHCDVQYFPRINPCVIMLVSRGDKLLLARSARFKSGFFSCLAGFMEVGETPEQTVAREVMEEVGISVTNIRYIKSQSWPFPSQLMLGFYADYAGGEITPDLDEIAEADWFDPQSLPTVPSSNISIAGELINGFIRSRKEA
ncbi:MAG: NAD(+) diphosphatase [SAR86 cluster bacterium]|uniref:NAD(+) diphosphatase n=1 Tax=SAR86 cluster bacterium TaxID=2030880 RepID=A0A2A4MVD5_9GAMM|nr:MAG: NAD(+) diphosphatase [SAR86 cluster bacterium]